MITSTEQPTKTLKSTVTTATTLSLINKKAMAAVATTVKKTIRKDNGKSNIIDNE